MPELPFPLAPAPVLSVLVGVFHAALYVLIRGSVGARLPFVVAAAILGAYGGQALATRVGDPLTLGDYGLTWASALAWAGIIVIALASMLGPTRRRTPRRRRPPADTGEGGTNAPAPGA